MFAVASLEGQLAVRTVAGFGTAGRASLVMNLVLLLSMLFAGFLVNTASIAPALQWIHYLSVFFYGFESLTTNEISGTQFTFTVSLKSSDVMLFVPSGTTPCRGVWSCCHSIACCGLGKLCLPLYRQTHVDHTEVGVCKVHQAIICSSTILVCDGVGWCSD